MKKSTTNIFISICVVIIICLIAFIFWIFENESFLNKTYVDMEIFIEKGDSPMKVYRTIFHNLETPIGFRIYLTKIKRFGAHIKYGYYSSSEISLGEFINNIRNGIETTIKVTIPEGYNVYEIATAMERMGIADKNEVIAKAFDPKTVQNITGEKYTSMEGFLSPGTYFFPKKCSIDKMFRLMYEDFKKDLPIDFKVKAEKQGLSEYQALILASIVQKETYSDAEAPIVASVFLNRLKLRMRLQADPTIIYGIYRQFDGNIHRKNIDDDKNIYNTYRHNGLPPTPISNPSTSSLAAVINPADTNYLYFVANKLGFHIFASTYAEHKKNVEQSLLEKENPNE